MPVLGRGGHDIKERPARQISLPDFCLPNTPDPTACGAVALSACAQPAECIPSLRFQTSAFRSCSKQTRTSMTPDKNNNPPHPAKVKTFKAGNWWSLTGSNRRPPECKSGALPAELRPQTGSRSRSPDNGGPGTTRTSDLTLIRGAL